jgi:serine/threonine protein kinase
MGSLLICLFVVIITGAVVDKNVEPMLVMEFFHHGSLYDVLHNNTMFMEANVLLNILQDISQGMRFLHSSIPQIIHRDLKSGNILVDRRFRAKIADFGFQERDEGHMGTPLWMAPELLRGEKGNSAATDVYSFGIILYEVYSRRDPYEGENISEALTLVADKTTQKRPLVPSNMPAQIQSIMTEALQDDADKRPSFDEVDMRLKRLSAETVQKETDAEALGKRITSDFLFDIFPEHVAKAIQEGREVEPEHRDMATIFFSDIVGVSAFLIVHKPRILFLI